MKKTFILFLLIITTFIVNAQNYQCLQYGPVRYFTNGNGYLRAMRIDSVHTVGSDTIYYPFHSIRGTYGCRSNAQSADGGSWLGKNVVQKSDGTFLFDNIWNDTVIIKTHANLGDSWIFFDDTTQISYKATVTGLDTMTVLGALDSIKIILIEADSAGIINPNDPVNGFKIKLSKNNGFAQVIDLYTFPYHGPDSINNRCVFFDFYLDRLLGNLGIADVTCYYMGYFQADTNNSIFHEVELYNPMKKEIYDFNVGDEFETEFDRAFIGNYYETKVNLVKVLTKTITPTSVSYTLDNHENKFTTTISGASIIYDSIYVHDTIGISADTSRLLSFDKLPEETGSQLFYHYFPHQNPITDSVDYGYCSSSIYKIDGESIYVGSGVNWQLAYMDDYYTVGVANESYGIGFGNVGQRNIVYTYGHDEMLSLLYSNKSGNVCGAPRPILRVNEINRLETKVIIQPNPTHDNIIISSEESLFSVIIYNMMGQKVRSEKPYKKIVSMDLSDLPPGVYLARINDAETRKIIKE